MKRSHFVLVLFCYGRQWGFIGANTIILPLATAVLLLNTDSSPFLSFFCSSHSLILTSSESYIWTWEVSSSRVIQGSYQQVFPQDTDKILGHDLLLLPGAMVFQRENHWISRHLSIKIQTRKKKSTFRPHFQQLDSLYGRTSQRMAWNAKSKAVWRQERLLMRANAAR